MEDKSITKTEFAEKVSLKTDFTEKETERISILAINSINGAFEKCDNVLVGR